MVTISKKEQPDGEWLITVEKDGTFAGETTVDNELDACAAMGLMMRVLELHDLHAIIKETA